MATQVLVPQGFEHPSDPSAHERGGLRALFAGSGPPAQRLFSVTNQQHIKDEIMDDDSSDTTNESNEKEITWIPSYECFLERRERLSKTGLTTHSTAALPAGFPKAATGPAVWVQKDLEDKSKYVINLTAEEIQDVENALDHFKALPGENGPDQVSKATFPLPVLEEKLEGIAHTVHSGLGFAILRGLDPKHFTQWENVILYLGITSYVAEKRGCQDDWGSMLVHLKDMTEKVAASDRRQPPYSNCAQPFHTDLCDVLTIYVIDRASSGGRTRLASSNAVYNKLAATNPDIIATLVDDSWIFDKREEDPTWQTRPILFDNGSNNPFFIFSRRSLTGSEQFPRTPGVPAMSDKQADALDAVHFAADEIALSIEQERGDIQFVNNLAVLHAREAFVDDNATGRKRHLMRLWLRNENLAWPTPVRLEKAWFNVYGESERANKASWRIDPDVEREQIVCRKMTCFG